MTKSFFVAIPFCFFLSQFAFCQWESMPIVRIGSEGNVQKLVNWREIAQIISSPDFFPENPFGLSDEQRRSIAEHLQQVNDRQILEVQLNRSKRRDAKDDQELNNATVNALSRGVALAKESEELTRDFFPKVLNERQLSQVRELSIYYASTLSFDEIIDNAKRNTGLELTLDDLQRLRIKMFEADQKLKLEFAKLRKEAWDDIISGLDPEDREKIEESLLLDRWK